MLVFILYIDFIYCSSFYCYTLYLASDLYLSSYRTLVIFLYIIKYLLMNYIKNIITLYFNESESVLTHTEVLCSSNNYNYTVYRMLLLS